MELDSAPPRLRVGHPARPHIQGLRAIAVAVVVAGHLTGRPVGASLGVDVFFVISGYLITGQLLRERELSGHISLRGFYARRVRRIMPMAIVVLLCTLMASYLLLTPERAGSTLLHSTSALLFVENWRLVGIGQDALRMTDSYSPVQHYWSLSIEEQFYLIWPITLLGLIWPVGVLARKGTLPGDTSSIVAAPLWSRAVVVGCLAAAIVASFGWAAVQSAANPYAAYHSTLARVWQLGVGALLAVLGPRLAERIPARSAVLHIALMTLGVVIFTKGGPEVFPGRWWSVVPVCATAAILISGDGARGPAAWVLSSSPFQFLGKISYSLYLWNLPIGVLVFAMFGHSWATVGLSAALLMLLSVVSFHAIEDPIRRSNWLSGKLAATTERAGRLQRPNRVSWGIPVVATAVVLAFGFGWYARTLRTVEQATKLVAAAARPGQPTNRLVGEPMPDGSEFLSALEAAQGESLGRTDWPDLRGDESWPARSFAPPDANCTLGPSQSVVCEFAEPGATKAALLVGDSQALAWLPGIHAALATAGYRLRLRAQPGCSLPDVPVEEHLFQRTPNATCADFWRQVIQDTREAAPELIIATSNFQGFSLALRNRPGATVVDEWKRNVARALLQLGVYGARVVLLDSPPGGRPVADCRARFTRPGTCESAPTADYRQFVDADSAAAATASTAAGKVRHVSVTRWFCLEDRCPSFVGDVPTYTDPWHLSAPYARFLAPELRQQLVSR